MVKVLKIIILVCIVSIISILGTVALVDDNSTSTTSAPTLQSNLMPFSSLPSLSERLDSSPAWDYSSNDVDVKGYYRADGTYVKPYSRTKPDSSLSNNYGYPGNYNPNTGDISK